MRIIAEAGEGSKRLPSWLSGDVIIVAIIVLASTGSFGLGYLAGRDQGSKGELKIEQIPLGAAALEATEASKTASPKASVPSSLPAPKAATAAVAAPPTSSGGQYVASKNGTKYFLPWCGSAKNIKEENKVWFASKEEAAAKGYSPAANCPGL